MTPPQGPAAVDTSGRRLRRRAVGSTIGVRVLGAALQGVTLLVLARLLGPEEFGGFAAVFAVGGFLGVLLGLGLPSLVLRIGAYGERAPTLAGDALVLGYAGAVGAGLLACCTGVLVLHGSWEATVAGAVLAASETAGRLVESVGFGLQRETRAQAILVLRRVCLLAAIAVAWLGAAPVLHAVVVGALVGAVVAPLGLWRLVRLGVPTAEVYRRARGFWLPTVLGRMEGLDTAIASFVLSAPGLGLYAAAGRVTSPLNIVTGSFLSIYTPRLAVAEPHDVRGVFRESLRALTLVACAMALVSPVIGLGLQVVLGSQYEGVAVVCTVFVLAAAVSAPCQAYTARLYAAAMTGVVLRVRLVAVPLGLALVAVLGWQAGPAAAACGLVVSQAVQLVGMAVAARRTGTSGRTAAAGSSPA